MITDASDTSTAAQPPLLLLDVDGVLNALGDDDEYATAWPKWCGGYATADGTKWPFTWAPAVIERLRAWHEAGYVEIQWLTTWGQGANGELRELLGLPELVVAGTYDEDDAGAATVDGGTSHASTAPAAPDPLSGRWWKYDVVRRVIAERPGRLVIWVDDELHDAASPFARWATGHDVIAIGPEGMVGLEPPHLDLIARMTAPYARTQVDVRG